MGKFQRSKVTTRQSGSAPAPTYTVNDLLAQANQALDTFEFELAHQFAMRALQMEPQNLAALEAAGSIEVELELFNEAKEVCLSGRHITLRGTLLACKQLLQGCLIDQIACSNFLFHFWTFHTSIALSPMRQDSAQHWILKVHVPRSNVGTA